MHYHAVYRNLHNELSIVSPKTDLNKLNSQPSMLEAVEPNVL